MQCVSEQDNCTMTETKLNSAPDDGISSVKFAPNSSQFLMVSSWDCTVRLYDINENIMRMKYVHSAPVLDCCFQVRDVINNTLMTELGGKCITEQCAVCSKCVLY